MDLLSQGRRHYLEKDYKAALEVFTEVVQASTDHIRLTALDHRAATFEKLDELQLALKDAKDMIVLKPGQTKGYLRCSKVLQLMGKDPLALQIYERGLGKVKIGEDTDRPLLQKMYNKLRQRQNPSRNLDPLVMLPNELVVMICHHLDMRDRVICLAVSKTWKRFLESSSDLWTTLDMRSAKRSVRMDSLKAYLRRSYYGVDRAYLVFKSPNHISQQLEMVVVRCKKLEFLECSDFTAYGTLGSSIVSALHRAAGLRTLIIKNCSMLLVHVVHTLSICPLLEHAAFHAIKGVPSSLPVEWPHLENMASLLLKSHKTKPHIRELNIDQLKTSTPNLRSLTLIGISMNLTISTYYDMDFTQWSKLERLEYSRSYIIEVPGFPPTLKYLDMSAIAMLTAIPPAAAINLPLLEVFLCEYNDFHLQIVSKIIQSSLKNGNLKVLRMGGLPPDVKTQFDVRAFAAPEVIELSLRAWWLTEERLLEYLRMFPAVKYLDLSRTLVTGVAIKELMTRESGPLKWLAVHECSKLSSDAVDYARSMGCTVEYSMGASRKYTVKSFRDRLAMSEL